MNQYISQINEPNNFGNDWGFYVDIENYKYDINAYTNKIIKRNRIYDNDYGDKYEYDYDYAPDYIYKPIIKEKKDERKEATNAFIKFTSATLITATVSFMIFYMS